MSERQKFNTARFFTENRHISWVLLAFVVLWGVWGYWKMPKRKDPEVPVRMAVAICAWPGASAEKVEQLVTQKIEEKIAENAKVAKIQSISRTSVGIVYVELAENVGDPGKQLDDIKLKLDSIRDLPQGAGPIDFVKDFGDTAALMLTVASPPVTEVEVSLRAREIQKAIEAVRAGEKRVSVVACVPPSISTRAIERRLDVFQKLAEENGIGRNSRRIVGSGFAGLDFESTLTDAQLLAFVEKVNANYVQGSEDHPDLWPPVVIRDPAGAEAALGAAPHDKYSYRDLDRYTDVVKKTLQAVPQVSKITRSGVLKEKIYLDYSQERLASYGLQTSLLDRILSARNITLPGGMLQVGGKNLVIDPSGEFHSEKEIGDVIVSSSASGTPLYLRDLVDVNRTYDTPARFLNFYQWRDKKGVWHRSRAITLAVQMKSGEQIAGFGRAVDTALHDVRARLPEDLIIARTSDQPLQVEENVDLFMKSLYEAIALVVLVALIGFWEWRSALLMALSIPLTLAMTFGMMLMLGVDLQQVSIASLIIALGLLVDDPVVAGDAIKRELAAGEKPIVAAWLGPTKLATAILFATITNIVAYLPLLLLRGDTGKFIYTLPVVLTCSLVASRIVSMTFIPLLGYYILRPSRGRTLSAPTDAADAAGRGAQRAPTSRFAQMYRKTGQWALEHRWQVVAMSFLFLALGGLVSTRLQKSFFPKDYSYLSYVDVWLPEDAPLTATNATVQRAEGVVRRVAGDKLASLTTFVGGGGPRFWFSVSPELQQLNYAQIVVQVKDKHDTGALVPRMQRALAAEIAGARCDVQQLETGPPIGIPVAIRISGTDIRALRATAEKVKAVFRTIPEAERVRDDWGAESFAVKLQVDPDRANLAGVTNLDVAVSSAESMNGLPVTTMREGDQQIPVVARLRSEERAQLGDVQNLYVSSLTSQQKVPLRQVSTVSYGMETEKLRRRNQFRTITVACFPAEGVLPSEVLNKARTRIAAIANDLPPGYKIDIGGEEEEQVKGFADMTAVMVISIVAIFVALVLQFRNAVKPLVVFAAIPYGVVGALIVLVVAGAPFGFMAFLGVSSLIGVIVSHVIVLFDFIEEAHHRGEPLNDALLDAGIVRLRPVLITVGATVLGLFPLASHGGPLWESMCYAQIGGLSVATAITLIMVPVIYAIFVRDLKIIRWAEPTSPSSEASTSSAEMSFA